MEVSTLNHAMQLHAHLLKTNTHVASSPTLAKLITFSSLSPAADLHYARSIFDSLHAPTSYLTNTMLRAYSNSPTPEEALLFFIRLRHQGIAPDPDNFTFPFLLASCARAHAPREGHQLHGLACKHGLCSDRHVHNSLIHMYSSCKQLDYASRVFDGMTDRDVVSWTSIINATVDADQPIQALQLFERMLNDGVVAPNDATLVSVLRACADAGALTIGRKAHRIAKEQRLDSKANVVTALIDMYAKCGCIDNAENLFYDQLVDKDVFAWTAMISGLANHGRSRDALDLFQQMVELGLQPDDRTITAVLCACRSAGWVAQGYRHYNSMHKYGLRPRIQHYGCMVDLLARAGYLDEAEGFISRMPIEPDAVLWRTLIWASKLHGATDRAERLMSERQLLEKDSAHAGNYVLLGNVYALAGKWEAKSRVRELMVRRRIGKLPGSSRIEVNGVVHEFEAGNSGHPEAEMIYEKLDEIVEKLRLEAGYEPRVSEVLLDLADEEKASQLHHHSEKLAVAFGLISTSPGDKILVVKNLRSCKDCHTVMKLVSKLYNREIIIRDRIKFHHFSKGSCSCGDYW